MKGGVGTEAISRFFEIISPILYGIAFAYLLAPLQNFLEYKLLFLLTKKSQKKSIVKLRRVLALILTLLLLLGAITAVVYIFIPGIAQSVEMLNRNIDGYIAEMNNRIDAYLEAHLTEGSILHKVYNSIKDALGVTNDTSLLSALIKLGGDWMVKLLSGDSFSKLFSLGSTVISVLINIIVAVMFTIYLLYTKERQAARMRKLITAAFKKERVERIYRYFYMTDERVGQFLRTRVVESILVGIVSYLVYIIIGLPYAPILALISGVTNIIPYFGPFIGAIPSGLFILVAAPDKLLPFAIAVLIIQQIDGNVLAPVIQSNTMKIDAFWVLVGLTVMGGIFGLPGMILGVPIFTVVYILVREKAEERLKKKGLPTKTDDYIVAHHERKKAHQKPPIVRFASRIKAKFRKKTESEEESKEEPQEAPSLKEEPTEDIDEIDRGKALFDKMKERFKNKKK